MIAGGRNHYCSAFREELAKGLRPLLAWLPDNRRVWFVAEAGAAMLDVVTGERSPLEQFA